VVEQARYGRLIMELRQEGENFVRQWTAHMSSGRTGQAHLMTMPVSHRREPEAALNHLVVLTGGPAARTQVGPALLPPERAKRWAELAGGPVQPSDLPFEDLMGSQFFRRDAGGTLFSEEERLRLRDGWRAGRLQPTSQGGGPMGGPAPEPPVIELTPDRILVLMDVDLLFESQMRFVRCRVAVECANPELLSAVNAAREQGTNARDDGTVTLRTLPDRDWRIAWLQTDVQLHNPGIGSGPTP
jgi:hypothetical protein